MTDISGRADAFALPSSLGFTQGLERYLQLVQRQAEMGCQLAVGWAGAWQTLSGVVLTQTSTIGEVMTIQARQLAEQATVASAALPIPVQGSFSGGQASRDPAPRSVPGGAAHKETVPDDWSAEEERLRNNVFDEVVARLLDNDIAEAVV